MTLRELIIQWLKQYPNEACHPDLIHNARAGYIETKNGLYFWHNERYLCL